MTGEPVGRRVFRWLLWWCAALLLAAGAGVLTFVMVAVFVEFLTR